jgi:glycosyltransferase involved in cell wall biosynthesis
VGDGDQRSLLQQQAQRLGLIESVRFWGTISNHELPDFYAAADLMVAPSHPAASGDNEGQGVVLLEAFAAGVCVVATRAGGIEEVITNGVTGILVEPQNPEALAQAIAALLSDPARRAALAANGQLKVQRYGWSRVAGEFDSVYREVMAQSRAVPAASAKRRLG